VGRTWSIVALLSAAAFGLLLWSVLAHSGLTRADPALATFIASHRPGWLTPVVQLVTWLGSSFFIIPFGVIAGGYFWLRRRTRRPLVMMAAAFLGAAGLYDIVKPAVSRTRPPAALQVGGPDEGWAFTSGHATQSIAFYGRSRRVCARACLAVARDGYVPAPRKPAVAALMAAAVHLVQALNPGDQAAVLDLDLCHV
jgi:hypothetical protein